MAHGYIKIDREKCKGCGLCISACPEKVINFSNTFNQKGYHPVEFNDPEKRCTVCGFCYLICPDASITVYRYAKASVKK
ncbi:MAG: ferredoxin family protein [Candidatus Aerophobetes bacterium]|nr:ferredoxin family protein [Candidatus Aerophobetes bacterium]